MLHQLSSRARAWFHSKRQERELDDELRFHVEKQTEANLARGMAPEEARRQALLALGGIDKTREECRDAWPLRLLEDLAQDVRYALRQLRRSPGFTVVAVLTLALGIGANTAIFSAVNALLLNPYPFPEPNRIVVAEARHAAGKYRGTGYRDFLDWREQNVVFDEMAIADSRTYRLTGQGEAERIAGGTATVGFLRVLGVQPAFGRFFTADEHQRGAPRVLVLSHAAWQQRFGGRVDVLGRAITLDGTPYTIIGVMPRRFAFPGIRTCEFWTPLRDNPTNSREQHQYTTVVARLKPGITVERAQADMTAIARRLEQQYPETNKGWGVAVTTIGQAIAGQAKGPLAILFSAVVFVLLLACANVAGLMLARASGRAKEMAVRASLGASRVRIVRQMLTESVLLALAGGGLGLAFARWLIDAMRAAAPPDLGLDATLRIDSTALGFTLAISLLTGILFGLAPALYGSKADLNTALKGGANAWGGGRARSRFLSGLVAGEVALSLVLLVSAALLTKDFLFLLRVDTGVRIEHVLTFALDLPYAKYRTAERATTFYQELLDRLRAAPGVEAAGAVGSLPMARGHGGGRFEIEGRPRPADLTEMAAKFENATPGYFRAMGIALPRGRDFDERDTATSPLVAIISETFARQFFPNEDPIGRRIGDDWHGGGSYNERRWRTIVGVVGDVKHAGPTRAADPVIYSPQTQTPGGAMFVAVRTAGDPAKLAAAVRGTVRALDRDVPVEKLRTMRQVLADSLSEPMMMTSLLAGFAAFALALAAIGIYGVIAYSVTQRTQEMGVRIALGASYGDVLALVVRKGALLAGAGVLIGVPAALAASRVIASLLYGVSPRDITVFAGIPVVLLLVALAASYIPARRAAKVDPVVALRYE